MSPQNILIDAYDYPLPNERIALKPLAKRDECKLLVYDGDSFATRVFVDLPDLLPPDSVLVYNNTRVINARLKFHKSTGATIEVFCLEPVTPADYAQNFAASDSCEWLCFIGNLKRWKSGPLTALIKVGDKDVTLSAERGEQRGNAWVVRFAWTGGVSFSELISAVGEIPIPPYLNRPAESSDAEDYQTVYSLVEGSVAAPTAGLHFTPEVLQRIAARSIPRIEVTLHVGAGTFRPVKSDAIGEHPMHSEFIAVGLDEIKSLALHHRSGHPVIAVGTTSVRTLESLYHAGCLIASGSWTGVVPQWYPYSAEHPHLSCDEALDALLKWLEQNDMSTFVASTRIIIAPGYDYKMVNGIITNFHQPRSTLLLLVSAFIGEETWRPMYQFALDHDYRFLSYGDACLLLPRR